MEEEELETSEQEREERWIGDILEDALRDKADRANDQAWEDACL